MLHITSSCRVLYTASAGRHTDPEVYPRPDGTVNISTSTVYYLQEHKECAEHMQRPCGVLIEMPAGSSPACERPLHLQVYICGEADSVGLPDDPISIQPRASAMKSLQARQLLLPSSKSLPAGYSHSSTLRLIHPHLVKQGFMEAFSPAPVWTSGCAHQEVGAAISSALSQGKVEAEQACYLPVSGDSTPVIGKLPGVEGCYMASGALYVACAPRSM